MQEQIFARKVVNFYNWNTKVLVCFFYHRDKQQSAVQKNKVSCSKYYAKEFREHNITSALLIRDQFSFYDRGAE